MGVIVKDFEGSGGDGFQAERSGFPIPHGALESYGVILTPIQNVYRPL